MSTFEPVWHPISTAPRDQTAILAMHAENKAGNMYVTWRSEVGSADYINPRTGFTFRPTHWMPLPPPPTVSDPVPPT